MKHNIIFSLEEMEQARDYWLEKLAGELEDVRFTPDHPSAPDVKREQLRISLPEDISARASALSKNQDILLYVVLLAAFKLLIFKYAGSPEIIVSSPVYTTTGEQYRFNTLILFKDTLAPGMIFKQLLSSVKQTVIDGYKNQHYALEKVLEQLGVESGGPSFARFIFMSSALHKPEPAEPVIRSAHNDMAVSIHSGDGPITAVIDFNAGLYRTETMQRIMRHYFFILEQVLADIGTAIDAVEIMSEEEKDQILHRFNAAEEEPSRQTLHRLFEQQAAQHPENTAVIVPGHDRPDCSIDYSQLNRQAGRLALEIKSRGALKGSIIGICTFPSLEMVIGMLAILKAGCAFLPINPELPPAGKTYFIMDSSLEILLTGPGVTIDDHDLPSSVTLLPIDRDSSPGPVSGREESHDDSPAAYVIYTSGTTGRAKGVLVPHRGVVNYALWRIRSYALTPADVTLQLLSYGFDGFGSNFYSCLLSGGTLVLVPEERKLDFTYVNDLIKTHRVTNTSLVPELYEPLIAAAEPGDLDSLRFAVLAGEPSSPALVARSKSQFPHIRLINEYGPTEASVTAAASLNLEETTTSIIGAPITNTRILILSPRFELLPVGACGELCISGPGLAHGYLNNPELTAERFSPAQPGHRSHRSYKTGDLARWLPDGRIEIFGRIDQQVKIRGIRIELGEIESHIRRHQKVKDAVVLAAEEEKDGQHVNKYLCAYVVMEDEVTGGELKEFLAHDLPDYMIPAHFIPIDKIPLTPNGKLDRRALPRIEIFEEAEYEEPQTPMQEMLASVWKEVLNLQDIGINDNFFTLGGDSIKVIQISSRLRTQGFSLEVRDVFENPTIKQVESCIKTVQRTSDQGLAAGETPLTPIQQWFFRAMTEERRHFNQAVMLYKKDGFDEARLKTVFNHLALHHDALRMVYTVSGDGVRQMNRGTGEGDLFRLEVMQLDNEPGIEERIEAQSQKFQQSIDLEHGPLLIAKLFKTQNGHHLLTVIHHLVVDGISWRIFLEDFGAAYNRAEKNEDIQLPLKTDSFKYWSEQMSAFTEQHDWSGEIRYWKSLEDKPIVPLAGDHEVEPAQRIIKNNRTHTLRLSKESTRLLVTEANRPYNTVAGDLLLAALGLTAYRWQGINALAVNQESHGRENLVEDLDVSRTIGWFTSQYPVVLELERPEDLSYTIKALKETLRAIPSRGIGFGMISYVLDQPPVSFQPSVSFNYLGQFGGKEGGQTRDAQPPAFGMSPMKIGEPLSPLTPQPYALNINAMISGGCLSLAVTYNTLQFERQSIDTFSRLYLESLETLIRHCAGQAETQLTPSDLGDHDLSIEELQDIEDALNN
jgi:amino acid adenylation domain-containing protein/non-ribosomal peptide synthase protein (TIGR01720 family)